MSEEKKLTQYAKRQARLTEEEKQKEKEIRRAKEKARYNGDEDVKKHRQYLNKRSAARTFLTKDIKEEDKKEFKEYLKNL